jgi:response regulator RpfG family c-di-GMP phosphodiesterase
VPRLRIVLCSGVPDTAQFKHLTHELGVERFLSKPVELDTLRHAVWGGTTPPTPPRRVR